MQLKIKNETWDHGNFATCGLKTILHKLQFILPPGSIVDQGILKESAEDKEDADPGPDVDGLCISHRWQRVLDARLRGGRLVGKVQRNIF